MRSAHKDTQSSAKHLVQSLQNSPCNGGVYSVDVRASLCPTEWASLLHESLDNPCRDKGHYLALTEPEEVISWKLQDDVLEHSAQ